MTRARSGRFAALAAAFLVAGCASKPRQLMPTPLIYQEPSSISVVEQPEIGRFPQEPYGLDMRAGGVYRDAAVMRQHEAAKRSFRDELRQRVARSKNKDVILYVHGFNETFATAAFTAAELCHFLGRESVCAFFTWPASSTAGSATPTSRPTHA